MDPSLASYFRIHLFWSHYTRFTQNKAQTAKRMWPKDQMPLFLQALKELFPKHDVDIFSDTNSSLMQCPLCQARCVFFINKLVPTDADTDILTL